MLETAGELLYLALPPHSNFVQYFLNLPLLWHLFASSSRRFDSSSERNYAASNATCGQCSSSPSVLQGSSPVTLTRRDSRARLFPQGVGPRDSASSRSPPTPRASWPHPAGGFICRRRQTRCCCRLDVTCIFNRLRRFDPRTYALSLISFAICEAASAEQQRCKFLFTLVTFTKRIVTHRAPMRILGSMKYCPLTWSGALEGGRFGTNPTTDRCPVYN